MPPSPQMETRTRPHIGAALAAGEADHRGAEILDLTDGVSNHLEGESVLMFAIGEGAVPAPTRAEGGDREVRHERHGPSALPLQSAGIRLPRSCRPGSDYTRNATLPGAAGWGAPKGYLC